MNISALPDPYVVAVALGAATVNNVLGLPLNVYVMWLILAGARETLASDFFSLNLAMSEIFFALSTAWYLVYVQLRSHFSFDAFMFSRGLLFTARPLFQCFICAECYIGVIYPMLFLRLKQLKYKVACCCVAWLTALASCIYSWCTYKLLPYLYGFFIQNFLFFFVMLFCCLSVLRALKRPGPGEKAKEKKKSSAAKRRAFKIIFLIMIAVAFNFVFYVAAIPLQCCLSNADFSNALSICTALALVTGFIQPLLYLHRAGKVPCLSGL